MDLMEQRLASSCDTCKQKRIKCDKQKPCAYCIQHKIDCSYSFLKKPGLKPGYGRNVLERLQELNATHSNIMERLQKLEYNGNIQQLTYLESRIEVLEQKLNDLVDLPKQNNKLPDDKTLKILLQAYFKYVHGSFPILNPMNSFQLIDSRGSAPLPTIYGMVICSLRYSDLNDHQINSLLTYCKSHILSTYIGMKDLEHFKALGLLTFYLFHHNNDQESWNLISLLVNGCKTLVKNNNWQKDESERNIIWNIYLLDVFNSVLNQTRLLSSVPNLLLPISSEIAFTIVPDDTLLARQQRTLSFHHYEILYDSRCFIIEILTFIYRFQNSKEIFEFNILQNDVSAWKQTLPSNYMRFIDDMDFQFKDYLTIDDFLFYNLYQLTMVFLSLSSYAFKVVDKNVCEEIVEFRLCNILKTYTEVPKFFNDQIFKSLGPIFAWSLFITAKLLNNGSHLDDIIDILYKIGEFWEFTSCLADYIYSMKQASPAKFNHDRSYNFKFNQDIQEVFELFRFH